MRKGVNKMPNKLTDNKDFFTYNNIDFDKAYEITFGARGGGKLFFFEQLCIKQREEINRLQAENERLENSLAISQKETKRYVQGYKTAKAEKQDLEVELQAMRNAANGFKAEVERLKGDSYVESETQKARPHFINAFEEALEKGNKPSGKVQFSKFQPLKANKIPLTEDLSEDGRGLSVEDLFKEISRLKAEVERLSTLAELGNTRANDYRVMRDRALKAESENERLKNHIQEGIDLAKQIPEMMELVKAEAYKEFAERAKEELYDWVGADNSIRYPRIKRVLDNLLKELVGDDNAEEKE